MESDYYQFEAMRLRNKDLSPDEYVLNAALGLSGEAGEIADIVKKWQYQGHVLEEDKVAEELGDLLWYAALMANEIGHSLGDVMQRNLDKLHARYPGGFSSEKSINREECPQMSPEVKNGPVLGMGDTGLSFAGPWDHIYSLKTVKSFRLYDGDVYIGEFRKVEE